MARTSPSWTGRALFSRSLRWILLKRLAGLSLVVCTLTAAGFFYVERVRLAATLRDGVSYGAARFERMAASELAAPGLGDHARLRRLVDDFQVLSQPRHLGVSALLILRDAQGRTAAENRNPDFAGPALDAWLATHGYPFHPENAHLRHELVFIDSRPYLHMSIPLHDGAGHVVAHAESLFAVRETVIRDATERMWLTQAMAVSLILITSGLLYPIMLRMLRRMQATSVQLMDANLETLNALGRASAKRDSDVDAHSHRVTLYAVRLGEVMALSPEDMRALIKGAFLHDVGKIGVPDAILRKPGRLTNAEMTEMRLHVPHGLDIVSRSSWLRDAAQVIGGHHERYDGKGYDRGLAGEDIPLTARVFAVADVFDALTSVRPYKDALPVDQALNIMRAERGTHFDPAALDAFLPLASDLYEHCAGKSADELENVLRAVCARHFTADAHAWADDVERLGQGAEF